MDTHRARSLRLLGILFAAALLAACQPTIEEVVAEHRAAVEAVFGQLRALEVAALGAPDVTTDAMAVGDERIVLDGEQSNALFIRAFDLAAPETAITDAIGATRAGTVETCGELLRGEFYGAAKGARYFLTECGRAEYVFVLRTVEERPAVLIDDESFEPGMYEGEVLLFRLVDGAPLGGFRVSARSSDEVQVTTDSTGISLDAIDRLNSDLSSKVFVDIDTKLRQHVPGVIP